MCCAISLWLPHIAAGRCWRRATVLRWFYTMFSVRRAESVDWSDTEVWLFYGTFGLSVVKDWDTDAESDGVVPSVFHLLAEGEVASAGMVGTDTGCQADAGQISRFGDSDPQFRCLYTELACLYFRAEGYSGTKDIRFGGRGDSTFRHPMQADRPAFPVRRPVRGVASVATYSPEVWPVRSPVDNGRC